MATRTVLSALGFITIGLLLKIALFPLHFWLPSAYTYAPSTVTAFLASTATKVSVYALLRVFFTVLAPANLMISSFLGTALLILALIAMFAGSLAAIFQQNIKRLLAYSSIAQIGYMVLGIALATSTGLAGGIIHLFNHALMKCVLFMAVGAVFYRIGSLQIQDYQGMAKRMPWTMAAFVVGGLSLIGLPMTVGFLSKWYLVLAVLEQGMWVMAMMILVSSLLAVVYIWRIVELAYFRPVPKGAHPIEEAPLSMRFAIWIMAFASVGFGVNAEYTLTVAEKAAAALVGS